MFQRIRDLILPPKSYAQYGEDLILWRVLQNIQSGFYIDVGAMDPDQESVTRLFYKRGWSGINIDARPSVLASFNERRVRDLNLACAVSTKRDPLIMYEIIEQPGLSTSIKHIADNWSREGKTQRAIKVPCRTLADICASTPRDIHFLKIDVEGAERDVIESGDFRRFRPWVLAIEAVVPGKYIPCHEEWEHLVLAAGYDFALFHKINRYYIAHEHRELITRFAAPHLAGEP